MLGDVARWLRILGEDCEYAPSDWSDDLVMAAAKPEDRVLLTRDAHLVRRARKQALRVVQVEMESTEDALVRVYRELGLVPEEARGATRCSVCNGPLEATDAAGARARAEALGQVPPPAGAVEEFDRFWSCRQCGQAYWRGGHWDTIRRQRARLLQRLGTD